MHTLTFRCPVPASGVTGESRPALTAAPAGYTTGRALTEAEVNAAGYEGEKGYVDRQGSGRGDQRQQDSGPG